MAHRARARFDRDRDQLSDVVGGVIGDEEDPAQVGLVAGAGWHQREQVGLVASQPFHLVAIGAVGGNRRLHAPSGGSGFFGQ